MNPSSSLMTDAKCQDPTTARRLPALGLAPVLAGLGTLVLLAGLLVGATGWHWPADADEQAMLGHIIWEIRLPRSLGAWAVGALLGLAGAIAQGLFRNPLAEPHLLGSSAGASVGVALSLAAAQGFGLNWVLGGALAWWAQASVALAAMLGSLMAMALTLSLARGAVQTTRLLLAGIVVSVVLGAATSWITLMGPDVLRNLQGFMMGQTGLIGWSSCTWLWAVWVVVMPLAWAMSRGLDVLSLGEETARSLGLPLGRLRAVLVLLMSLCAAVSVAQAGLIAFVGLLAPHLARAWSRAEGGYRWHVLNASLAGGLLLALADVGSRGLMAPQDLPVGILTSVIGGVYLLARLYRRSRLEQGGLA